MGSHPYCGDLASKLTFSDTLVPTRINLASLFFHYRVPACPRNDSRACLKGIDR